MQLRERYLLARRLGRSVEFTACAGKALAYAWSVVPSVNPGVVWCSFCVGRDFALLGQLIIIILHAKNILKADIRAVFYLYIFPWCTKRIVDEPQNFLMKFFVLCVNV